MSRREQWGWVYDPHKTQSQTSEKLKKAVNKSGKELIMTLRSRYIKKPPKDVNTSYVIDISCKWIRHFFYFTAEYHCRSENAITPYFKKHFARLGHQGKNKFKISYMRHNDKWHDMYLNKSLNEAMTLIKNGGNFGLLEP